MAIKINKRFQEWIEWNKPDISTIKGLIIILILIAVFVFLLIGNPFENTEKIKESYQGVAKGTIISIENKEYLGQSQTGNHPRSLGVIVNYNYVVNDSVYHVSTFFSENKSNLNKLDKIRSGYFEIRYKLDDPSQSIILAAEKDTGN
ncbi:MAG: hypothetical protein KDC09_07090 [Bacteroidales bacterium]|nr:hypothetical protein [Bacteroidales bacterium]